MHSHNLFPGAKSLARIGVIGPAARKRAKWLDWYRAHGNNARLTCRHFGISPDTFYLWKRRFKPGCLSTLVGHSTRPKRFRQSRIPPATLSLVIRLREEDMGLSKYKLERILSRDYGVALSPSSINRILVKQGLIASANLSRDVKRRRHINYVIPRLRVAKEQRYLRPGNLVQVDTKHLSILGQKFYQLTAIDCYSKFGFSWNYWRITSDTAADFLSRLIRVFPFPVRAIQTDNGSEFLKWFHFECLKRGIGHYFSHPQTPKDNALIERFIQTTIYELWLFDQTLVPELDYLNRRLSAWVDRYNTYRPHQSLGYLTPVEYLKQKGAKVYGR